MVNTNHSTSRTVKLRFTVIQQDFSITHRQPYIIYSVKIFSIHPDWLPRQWDRNLPKANFTNLNFDIPTSVEALTTNILIFCADIIIDFTQSRGAAQFSTSKQWDLGFVPIFQHNYQPAWLTELTSTAIVFWNKVNIQKWRKTWDGLYWRSLSI